MRHDRITAPVFVIKAEDLPTLTRVKQRLPEPLDAEWINRGTDQKLRPSTVEMLRRTSPHEAASPSVAKLHRSAGLRVVFKTEAERDHFAREFVAACARERSGRWDLVTGLFEDVPPAERAVADLIRAEVPHEAICLLWRPAHTIDPSDLAAAGHSKLSVAASVTGGGIAGAVLGGALMMIPGIGQVAAVGALAASAAYTMTAVTAIIGATGGAIARMLTDLDVDGRDADYYERQIRLGKVFVLVDLRIAACRRAAAEELIIRNGGVIRRN